MCAAQHCEGLVKTPESACSAGGDCLPTKALTTCDDKNPCTTDSCSGWNLTCQNTPGYTGTCVTGTACVAANCATGTCVASTADKLWSVTAASATNDLAAGAVPVGGGTMWAVGRTNKPGDTLGDTLLQPLGVGGELGAPKVYDLLGFGLDEQLRGVAVAGPESIVVSGRAQNAGKDYQLFLANLHSGGVGWAVPVGGPEAETAAAVARIPSSMPEGGAGWVLAGGSLSSGVGADKGDAYLVRFDALGAITSAQYNGFGGAEHLTSVAVLDGTHAYGWGFVAVGHTKSGSNPQNAYLWRSDAKMQLVWQKGPDGGGLQRRQPVHCGHLRARRDVRQRQAARWCRVWPGQGLRRWRVQVIADLGCEAIGTRQVSPAISWNWTVHPPGQCSNLDSAAIWTVQQSGQRIHLDSAVIWTVQQSGQRIHLDSAAVWTGRGSFRPHPAPEGLENNKSITLTSGRSRESDPWSASWRPTEQANGPKK